MRYLLPVLLALPLSLAAEDYQCGADAGCPARINQDGEIEEVTFRKGDLVSTDAGWLVSPDDGWVKIQSRLRLPCAVNAYVGSGASVPIGLALGVPRARGTWAVPTALCLVGR